MHVYFYLMYMIYNNIVYFIKSMAKPYHLTMLYVASRILEYPNMGDGFEHDQNNIIKV